MKKLLTVFCLGIILCSCGGGAGSDAKAPDPYDATKNKESDPPSYDPKRGEGKFKDVEVSPTLDAALAEKGKKVYEVKCGSCHKLSDERLVGPGWKGISQRRIADWVMNFVTNTETMIDKDPEVQAQLEICLVRMPNQNLTDEDARSIYEFMRKNDGVK